MNFFSAEGLFYRTISRIGDLFILNILFLGCSIPVFTIGASATAMYSGLLKLVRNESGYLAKEFFKSFKQNFKQATLIWLMFLGAGIVLYLDFFYVKILNGSLGHVLQVVLTFFVIIYVALLSFVFAVQSQFENRIRQTIRISLYLAIGYLPLTIILMIINVLPILIVYIWPPLFWRVLPLMLVLGISGLGFGGVIIIDYIFRKHIPTKNDI